MTVEAGREALSAADDATAAPGHGLTAVVTEIVEA
jgi:hypothetical protein